jgi:hypothetical protein
MTENQTFILLQIWGVLSFVVAYGLLKKIGSAWKQPIPQLKFIGFVILFSITPTLIIGGCISIRESASMLFLGFLLNGIFNLIVLKLLGYSISWFKIACAFTAQFNIAGVLAWQLKPA